MEPCQCVRTTKSVSLGCPRPVTSKEALIVVAVYARTDNKRIYVR